MQQRQGGHAEIHRPVAAQADLDAAVLGHAALGDVQPGEDFHARGHGVLDGQRQVHGLEQGAVLAVADLHGLLERLDVDVADPVLHRLDEDAVDQLDDRRVRGGELLVGPLIGGAAFDLEFIGRIRHQGAEVLDLGDRALFRLGFEGEERVVLLVADTVVLAVGVDDVLGRGDADVQFLLDGILQLLDLERVGGLGHGELQGVAGQAQGKGHELFGRLVGEQGQGLRAGSLLVDGHHREVVHPAEEVGDGVAFDDTALQQDASQPFTGLFLDGLGLIELGGGDVARLAEEFPDLELAGAGLVLDGPFGGASLWLLSGSECHGRVGKTVVEGEVSPAGGKFFNQCTTKKKPGQKRTGKQ